LPARKQPDAKPQLEQTRLYYWIHHTGQHEQNTGVQRVVRNLAAALAEHGHGLIPVRWCPERQAIVRAEARWVSGLASSGGPRLEAGPEEGEPLHLTSVDEGQLAGRWLLVPEVPHVAGEDAPSLAVALDYARFYGLRTAAIFYDLIPLRQPGYESMSAAHDRYARALVGADLLLAISQFTARDLVAWWTAHDYERSRLPRVLAVALPEEILGVERVTEPRELPDEPIRFVTVGTVEPRKNQIETMRAFARLCARRTDLDLRLDVVGAIHHAVADQVTEIVSKQPGIRLHEYLPDEDVHDLVRASHATVFTSLYEGFGLPIAESLWLGTPCLGSGHGPMAEIAAPGGCLTVPAADGAAIELGLEQLAEDAPLRLRLTREACERELRSWRDYADDVLAAMRAAPPLERITVIDSAADGADEAGDLAVTGAAVRLLHWRSDSRTLLPGASRAPELPTPGAGYLHGEWALLTPSADPDRTNEVIRAARGLGMRVAVEAESDTPPSVLASSDLNLFATAPDRDAALAEALRSLPRTVTLRDRFRVGRGSDALSAIRDRGGRLTAAGSTRRPSRVYYWVGLTVQQPFNTGVQRVTRLLAAALERAGVEVVPVKWDDAEATMAPISLEDAAHLARWSGPTARQPKPLPDSLAGEWLFLPEITVPMVAPDVHVVQIGRELGMRTAGVFYDLIPAKMPENYPDTTLESLRAYWHGLSEADLVLPISWTAAADFGRWLVEEGPSHVSPTVVPCPLAGEGGDMPRAAEGPQLPAPGEPLHLLAVGTWEPRKNYPRLLRALTAAQTRASRPIRLTIVGRRAGFDELDAEIDRLAVEAGAALHGHVSDDELHELHAASAATVFGSWEEGFGLPVLESLWHGRPCLCHSGSAMAELVPGGGVLAVDMLDEAAIEDALVRLADEPDLLARLGREAVTREIRSWDEYAEDIVRALSRAGSAPGWPLPAVARRQPLLTCAITTYNRAPWLRHSLSRLLELTRPWRDVVEVVVCDNASTDDTSTVIAQFKDEPNFSAHRNATNVGMLGNLGVTARASRGAYVWLLGDDDLLTDHAIESVLEGLAAYPEVEMAYLNYAYTHSDDPHLDDVAHVLADATPIAEPGANRYVDRLRDVAGLNENLFTAIYTCAFRRDHALRAYQLDTRGDPFSSLATCVPSSVYALAALQDRPAWWVGEPAVVVNMNVSWLRWALLWHLERMPDLFEEAERQGVDPARLDQYRLQHLVEAERWVRTTYFDAEDAIRTRFSLARLLERSKHLPDFRDRHLEGVRRAYSEAWAAGRVAEEPVPPDELFAAYGL
jgi:glycosyltransferase involved in cell wall biosynthesis